MVNEMVHLRLDAKMRSKIRDAVKNNMFSSETEFIRNAIREQIELYKKIRILDKMRGTLKPSKNHKRVPISEVFRAVGLED